MVAGVPQASVLGLFLFLVSISMTHQTVSNVKFFVDDTSIFSVAHDPVKSVNAINKALSIITRRAFKFNPDWSKQAQEVIFARKTSTINYAALINYALINLLSTLFMAKKQHHKSIFGMTQIKLHGHLLQKKKKPNKGFR